MQNTYFAIEYEFFFNPILSLSIEGGQYSKDHYSQYKDYTYDDGTPIYQNLSLRMTSVELNLRIYPIGHRYAFNPYIGGGLGIHRWLYEQWGDFINFNDLTVDEGYADTKAYTFGFNARAGFLFKFKRTIGFSFEARYLFLKGELSSLFEGFEKFDLSGLSFTAGINLFF
jgi:outer membrane protein W